MSIRIIALYIVITALAAYAWKDWFKSLCGLILLMAFMGHEDMPKNIAGIQGLNLWNVLFFNIFLVYLLSRRPQGLRWDMPGFISVLLVLYLVVVLVGVLRALFDRRNIPEIPVGAIVSEELINTIKWVLPALLLYDGCRTRQQARLAVVTLVLLQFLIAGQIVKKLPLSMVFGSMDEQYGRNRGKLIEELGFSADDMSTVLAGTSWGMVAALPLVRQRKYRLILLPAIGLVVLAQAMTGGRAGYAAWGATGLIMCAMKWRKYLLLAPVVVVLLPFVFPTAAERMMFGFGEKDVSGQTVRDNSKITSGRSLIWPYVIDEIGKSPIIGHGRLAMKRTGLTRKLMINLSEPFPHPHCMYLETLLDNGILGSIPIWLFWGTVLVLSGRLFRTEDPLFSAIGGLTFALLLTQLIAGIGAQHFYPKESTVALWIAMLLTLRVYYDKARHQVGMLPAETQVALPVTPQRPALATCHEEFL
ncbi:MAG: O-antigen ligase family protein [Planctomycetes bacterium]|nr:O-antigen ligase family protein [Planctomycetota bacterium]